MPEPNGWPGPCSYCSLEDGGNLFPDLLTRLAAGDLDGYNLFAVARKTLCTTVRLSKVACNPETCRWRMIQALEDAQSAAKPMMRWGWHVKAISRDYRAQHDARQNRCDIGSVFSEALKELGFTSRWDDDE